MGFGLSFVVWWVVLALEWAHIYRGEFQLETFLPTRTNIQRTMLEKSVPTLPAHKLSAWPVLELHIVRKGILRCNQAMIQNRT